MLADTKVYEQFAGWLVNVYVKKAGADQGQPYKASVAEGHVSMAVNRAAKKYPDHDFFECLNIGTSQWRWLKRLKSNIQRECFQKIQDEGKSHESGAATPLYATHVTAMALAQADLNESPARKFAILAAFQAGARSSEVSFMTLGSCEWDPLFQCMFAEAPQLKTSKNKAAVLGCGANRHLCRTSRSSSPVLSVG